MNFKDFIIKKFNDFFYSIGIEPIYGITLLFILLVLPTTRSLKNWNEIPKNLKKFYILGWIGASLGIIICILHLLQIY